MYFLNASESETTISFCAVIVAWDRACEEKGAARGSFVMEARHSRQFHVETPELKYLMVESSRPMSAVVLLLRPSGGRGRTFSTESSIRFECHLSGGKFPEAPLFDLLPWRKKGPRSALRRKPRRSALNFQRWNR